MKGKIEISRRRFITNSAWGGIGTLTASGMMASCNRSDLCNREAGPEGKSVASIALRPYRLLCAMCSIGEGTAITGDTDFKAIRENPDVPVTLVCNAGDVFAFQDLGKDVDSHASEEFTRKRDLEILQRIDLPPGVTLPARIILHRIWDRIDSLSGICDPGDTTSARCKGCPKSSSGFYEKGREASLRYSVPDCGSQLDFSEADLPGAANVLIVPRTREERAEAKRKSLEAMYKAEAIAVRPHILLCAVCQYGGGTRPPFENDNLPEMLQYVIENPEARIRFAEAADWMMCAPCPSMNKFQACVNIKGHGGLSNQLRDVRVLEKLEHQYGDIVNGRDLYRMIFERIPSTAPICGSVSKGVTDPSVWHDPDGHHSESLPEYVKGMELLKKEFGFYV